MSDTAMSRAIEQISSVRGSGGDGDLARVRDAWGEFIYALENLQECVGLADFLKGCHYDKETGDNLTLMQSFVESMNLVIYNEKHHSLGNHWCFVGEKMCDKCERGE
jgi:hypothetical protein